MAANHEVIIIQLSHQFDKGFLRFARQVLKVIPSTNNLIILIQMVSCYLACNAYFRRYVIWIDYMNVLIIVW